MKKYVWDIVEDNGVFVLRKPTRGPSTYSTLTGGQDAMVRSHRATVRKWKSNGWSIGNEYVGDHAIIVWAEEPKRTTKQFLVHLDIEQHKRAMRVSTLTGVGLSKMIREALEDVLDKYE